MLIFLENKLISQYTSNIRPVHIITLINCHTQAYRDLLDSLHSYARANLALINVYIRDPYATHFIRDEELPTIVFAAGFGGLLGVFSGN